MATTKININLQKMAIPNKPHHYWCYLAILRVLAYIETQNPNVNVEAEIVAVYYGMSVDRSRKILHTLYTYIHSFIMFGSRRWIYKHWLDKIQNKTEYTNCTKSH